MCESVLSELPLTGSIPEGFIDLFVQSLEYSGSQLALCTAKRVPPTHTHIPGSP